MNSGRRIIPFSGFLNNSNHYIILSGPTIFTLATGKKHTRSDFLSTFVRRMYPFSANIGLKTKFMLV